MRWILIDIVLALLALALLAVLLLRLWRQVKTLSRLVGSAGERVATATDALASAQAGGPLGQSSGGSGADDPTRHVPGGHPLDRSRSGSRA